MSVIPTKYPTSFVRRWLACLATVAVVFLVVGCERPCNPRISDAQAIEAARALLSKWSIEDFEKANTRDEHVLDYPASCAILRVR